jgi:hypothetical protein
MAAYIVFSAAASSLPPPLNNSGLMYQWLYKFANSLSANVSALRGKANYEQPANQEIQTNTKTVEVPTTPKVGP